VSLLPLRAGIIACAVAASAWATAGPAAAKADLVFFRTPSGNIGCLYAAGLAGPAALRCDVRSRLQNPTPTRPPGCDVDWGDSLSMRRTGRASLTCHGDTVFDPRARVLAYGTRWSRGGLTCTSQTAGLRCTNAAGHGFFLSRESWKTF
jgi:hypothetical protein